MANEDSKLKFLNLDEIAPPQRTVKISGKEYQVLDMSVEVFIESTRLARAVKEKESDMAGDEQIEEAVRSVKRWIPDIEDEVLAKLSFQKLSVLIQFINGALEEESAKAGEPTTAPNEADKPAGGVGK